MAKGSLNTEEAKQQKQEERLHYIACLLLFRMSWPSFAGGRGRSLATTTEPEPEPEPELELIRSEVVQLVAPIFTNLPKGVHKAQGTRKNNHIRKQRRKKQASAAVGYAQQAAYPVCVCLVSIYQFVSRLCAFLGIWQAVTAPLFAFYRVYLGYLLSQSAGCFSTLFFLPYLFFPTLLVLFLPFSRAH